MHCALQQTASGQRGVHGPRAPCRVVPACPGGAALVTARRPRSTAVHVPEARRKSPSVMGHRATVNRENKIKNYMFAFRSFCVVVFGSLY